MRRLHEDSVTSFVNSPGFGVIRRIEPDERHLRLWTRDETPIAQPGAPFLSAEAEQVTDPPAKLDLAPLREMHLGGVVDFVNPQGFGWIVSRDKVAGFRPHQFSQAPENKSLKVRTVELVGLIKHTEPVVYVSDKLPSMKDARTAARRPLNAFESAGLQMLEQGDDLFVRETAEGIRLLGAVRAVEQCTKCHGGERGDLLGAFSYCLERTK